MVALETTRHIPYALRVETPSGDVHKYVPGGVINVSQVDAEWLVNTGDWKRVNSVEAVAEVQVVEVSESVEVDEELDIPDLDEFTKDELVAYAEGMGIDINPRDKKDDIRAAIDDFLDELEAED